MHNSLEAFWSRVQVELLDRKKWNTRLELANAIFEYLEIGQNRKRRHSPMLGGLSRHHVTQLVARPGFPAPAASHVAGKLWHIDEVREWARHDGRYLHGSDNTSL